MSESSPFSIQLVNISPDQLLGGGRDLEGGSSKVTTANAQKVCQDRSPAGGDPELQFLRTSVSRNQPQCGTKAQETPRDYSSILPGDY